MRHFFFLFSFLLFSCSGENEPELINRALNDEAMQELNRLFEQGNEDLYAEVEKSRASLMATKGKMFEMDGCMLIRSRFYSCKEWLDKLQENIISENNLPAFHPGEIYYSSLVPELDQNIEFAMSAINDSVLDCINVCYDYISHDTLYHIFKELDSSEFDQQRDYKTETFSADMDKIIADFMATFGIGITKLSLIEALEALTLCRSTLLIAERKLMRFHNETILSGPIAQWDTTINIMTTTDKINYKPGEIILLNSFPFLITQPNYTSVSARLDSVLLFSRPYSKHIYFDTIKVPTDTPGNHSILIDFKTLSGDRQFQYSYQYTVIPQ